MKPVFTHIDSDSGYPYPEGIDPYKYENNFDYELYDKTQMKITVCSVPWDVGLIHVGNAQIGGLGNVVKFETPEDRDSWLDSIENKYTWETLYREYHTGGFIEVPLPYEKAVLFNYVYVEYNLLPVDYAEGGKRRFFFFIRSCESLSPSNSRIEILRDTFQTFIYDIDVSYLMLERGHAPMSITSADRYLASPIDNTNYLLAEDVNYGDSYKRIYASSKIFNSGDMWAVIVSSGNPRGSWGTKAANNWTTPDGVGIIDGQPTYYAIALDPDKLTGFLSAIDRTIPQYKSTIKAVFFIAKNLVNTASAFTFCDYEVRPVSRKNQNIDFLKLTKAQFNYGEKYENLAKLYTWPYAYLEVTDETGDATIIKIEETSGNLSLAVTTSLAYPWIAIDSHINGIGKGGATIEFSNITDHSFTFSGDWYSQLRRWAVPTFAVTQTASVAYDYSTHFERRQKAAENTAALQNALDNASTSKANADASAETQYSNAIDSANTNKANADASAATTKENADSSAVTSKANADRLAEATKVNADASANTAKTNADAITNTSHTNTAANIARVKENIEREQTLRTALKNRNNKLMVDENERGKQKLTNDSLADIEASLAVEGAENEATAIGAANNALSTIATNAAAGAIAGTALGSIVPGAGNAIGAGTGALGGAVSGLISAAGAGFSAPISMSTNSTLAEATREATLQKRNIANNYNDDVTGFRTDYNNATHALNEQAVSEISVRNRDIDNAANDSTQATELGVNSRSLNTTLANNVRSYNASVTNNAASYNTEVDINADSYNTSIANNARTNNTARGNAARSRSTDLANNKRSYDNAVGIANRNKGIADSAITADIAQAGLEAPKEYGAFSNGETSVTRPQGVFANIVTQSSDAIAQAGDYFLRFGYAVNRSWEFKDFNLMPHFTYWKASDMWISGNNVPDAYLDEIRFFFLGGVCVWRRPEDIGNISIYENR